MKISKLYGRGNNTVLSCEFFAPKTAAGFENLYKVFDRLKSISPGFYSVTYGAGGTTAQPTHSLVNKIQDEFGVCAMPHMTCVSHSTEYLKSYIGELRDSGLENILALRGDMPGGGQYEPHSEGLTYASDVVALIKNFNHFCIGVAAHPEGHPNSKSLEEDVIYLKKKFDAGADFAVTQFFFDNEYYFKFLDLTKKIGIDKPIIPGIIPFVNAELTIKFAGMNRTVIPDSLKEKMLDAGADKKKSTALGTEQAINQCRGLLDHGVPGIHFFTLNNANPTLAVTRELFG